MIGLVVALGGCGDSSDEATTRQASTVPAPPERVNVVGQRAAVAEKILRAHGWRTDDGTSDLERSPMGGRYSLFGDDNGDWIVCYQSYSELVDESEDVYLTTGPSCTVTIPRLIGRRIAEVGRMGDRLGVLTWPESVDRQYPSDEDLSADWIVCDQDPRPGARENLADDDSSVIVFASRPGHCPK
jgi:hypothetical protein